MMEGTHPITVAMLMEHTAGFDDFHFLERAVDDPEITLAEGLAYHPHSRVSRWQPGTYTSYSNSGPPTAAYVVEKYHAEGFRGLRPRAGIRPARHGCDQHRHHLMIASA